MEIKIDLDMNQIDYDAINTQIQQKIADMDLEQSYQISAKIHRSIREQVENEVNDYLKYGTWGGLNDKSELEIRDEIHSNIKKLIRPHVDNIFNQIPQEELHNIISNLIPKVLMDLLISDMKSILTNYYYSAEENTMRICEERIQNMLRR